MSFPSSISLLRGAQILELDPETIDVDLSGRIGFYFEDKAETFGCLMAQDGQRDPVKVSRAPKGSSFAHRLHVGLHRTMGARFKGLPIYAIEVKGTPEYLRELEMSENLHRRPMEPLERAKFVHAWSQVAQERIAREHGQLRQQQLAVNARWARVKAGEIRVEQALQDECDDTADTMSAVYGWQESAAVALGLDKRTIRRALELYRLVIEPFPAELVRALADRKGVGDNAAQLKLIAEVRDEAQRGAVIEALTQNTHLSAEMARVQIGLDAGKVSEDVAIWDPCCGYGHSGSRLEAWGFGGRIILSDLVENVAWEDFSVRPEFFAADFLECHTAPATPVSIFFNPPYSYRRGILEACVRQALRLATHRVVVLAPNKWLAPGKNRAPLFRRDFPPQTVMHFSQRPSMPPGDVIHLLGNKAYQGGQIDYCAIAWDLQHPTAPGETRTVWLPRLDDEVGGLIDQPDRQQRHRHHARRMRGPLTDQCRDHARREVEGRGFQAHWPFSACSFIPARRCHARSSPESREVVQLAVTVPQRSLWPA